MIRAVLCGSHLKQKYTDTFITTNYNPHDKETKAVQCGSHLKQKYTDTLITTNCNPHDKETKAVCSVVVI